MNGNKSGTPPLRQRVAGIVAYIYMGGWRLCCRYCVVERYAMMLLRHDAAAILIAAAAAIRVTPAASVTRICRCC